MNINEIKVGDRVRSKASKLEGEVLCVGRRTVYLRWDGVDDENIMEAFSLTPAPPAPPEPECPVERRPDGAYGAGMAVLGKRFAVAVAFQHAIECGLIRAVQMDATTTHYEIDRDPCHYDCYDTPAAAVAALWPSKFGKDGGA